MTINMDKVTDLNNGVPYTKKISPQGEVIDNYTGYAKAGLHFKRDMSTKDIAIAIRNAIKEAGFTKKNGFSISITSSYYSMGSSISIKIRAVPFQILSNEYIEYMSLCNSEHKVRWISDKNCNCNSVHELIDWEWHLFGCDKPRYGRYTIQARFLKDILNKIMNSFKYDDSDSMQDYFHTNFYGNVSYDWDLERVEVIK